MHSVPFFCMRKLRCLRLAFALFFCIFTVGVLSGLSLFCNFTAVLLFVILKIIFLKN